LQTAVRVVIVIHSEFARVANVGFLLFHTVKLVCNRMLFMTATLVPCWSMEMCRSICTVDRRTYSSLVSYPTDFLFVARYASTGIHASIVRTIMWLIHARYTIKSNICTVTSIREIISRPIMRGNFHQKNAYVLLTRYACKLICWMVRVDKLKRDRQIKCEGTKPS
jgi:hypothetical protein